MYLDLYALGLESDLDFDLRPRDLDLRDLTGEWREREVDLRRDLERFRDREVLRLRECLNNFGFKNLFLEKTYRRWTTTAY